MTIKGEVRRPGRYELKEGMTLSDLIVQARGLKETALFPKVEIYRVISDTIAGENRIDTLSVKFDNDEIRKFKLKDQDMVFIRSIPLESPRP